MSEDTTYNGWKNYETWCVNLWIGNDEGTNDQAIEIAQEAIEEAPNDLNVIKVGIWSIEQAARYNTAKHLQEWVEEWIEEIHDGGDIVTDLVGAALSEVDWDEIASAYIQAVGEQS